MSDELRIAENALAEAEKWEKETHDAWKGMKKVQEEVQRRKKVFREKSQSMSRTDFDRERNELNAFITKYNRDKQKAEAAYKEAKNKATEARNHLEEVKKKSEQKPSSGHLMTEEFKMISELPPDEEEDDDDGYGVDPVLSSKSSSSTSENHTTDSPQTSNSFSSGSGSSSERSRTLRDKAISLQQQLEDSEKKASELEAEYDNIMRKAAEMRARCIEARKNTSSLRAQYVETVKKILGTVSF